MQPKIKITGQKELFRALAKFGEEAEHRIDQITKSAATRIADEAKNLAPRGMETNKDGNATINIAQLINVEHTDHLFYSVKVQAKDEPGSPPIAAYLEFGTGAYFDKSHEWKDIASEFFVNGKGYMPAHPFLYPAYNRGKIIYEANLKALLENLTKKHSK